MKAKSSLITLFVLSIAGLLFSGYLSYQEIFAGSCATSFVRCGSWELAELPACVYGFIMYLVIFIVSLLGISGLKKGNPTGVNHLS